MVPAMLSASVAPVELKLKIARLTALVQIELDGKLVGVDRDIARRDTGQAQMMMARCDEDEVERRPGRQAQIGIRPLPVPQAPGGGDIGRAQMGTQGKGKSVDGRLFGDGDGVAECLLLIAPIGDVGGDDAGQHEPVDAVSGDQDDETDGGEDHVTAHAAAILSSGIGPVEAGG